VIFVSQSERSAKEPVTVEPEEAAQGANVTT
jgi:hypothetical protein